MNEVLQIVKSTETFKETIGKPAIIEDPNSKIEGFKMGDLIFKLCVLQIEDIKINKDVKIEKYVFRGKMGLKYEATPEYVFFNIFKVNEYMLRLISTNKHYNKLGRSIANANLGEYYLYMRANNSNKSISLYIGKFEEAASVNNGLPFRIANGGIIYIKNTDNLNNFYGLDDIDDLIDKSNTFLLNHFNSY